MPDDYDLNAKAVSGLAPGRGKGKIAGMPEGVHPSAPRLASDYRSANMRRGSGVIRGTPVGIHGKPHDTTIGAPAVNDKGAAIRRKLGRS